MNVLDMRTHEKLFKGQIHGGSVTAIEVNPSLQSN